jgi:hypothetical protein
MEHVLMIPFSRVFFVAFKDFISQPHFELELAIRLVLSLASVVVMIPLAHFVTTLYDHSRIFPSRKEVGASVQDIPIFGY